MPGDNPCGNNTPLPFVPVMDDEDDFFGDYENQGFHHFEQWALTYSDYTETEYWRLHNIDTIHFDHCRSQILKKLIDNLSENPLGRILKKISRATFESGNLEKFTVRYNIKPLAVGTVAQTDSFVYNTSSHVFSCAITLDSLIANSATDIYVAGTILHETIHAYMSSLLYRRRNGSGTLAQIQAMSYDSVFNEYVDTLVASNTAQLNAIAIIAPQYQHNYMANKLINIIADALKIFDGNSIGDDRYYWFMSWKGLFLSGPWKQHWPNYAGWPIVGAPYTTDDSTRGMRYALTPLRLDSINTSIGNERVANANAKGHPPVPGGCY